MLLYHLHPIIVHFPIAVLIVAFGGWVVGTLIKKYAVVDITTILLMIGTLGAWAAIGTGLLAYNTAPHVPEAWEVQWWHRFFGFGTGISALLLLAWRYYATKNRLHKFVSTNLIEPILWMTLMIFLLITGYLGGRLVFDFGVGVMAQATWPGSAIISS